MFVTQSQGGTAGRICMKFGTNIIIINSMKIAQNLPFTLVLRSREIIFDNHVSGATGKRVIVSVLQSKAHVHRHLNTR